ncbi:MAG TPA: hypothetical protein DCO72_01925 [Ruminococcus sp.]|nr:hypothetical protein [Ruminococcus sp.]
MHNRKRDKKAETSQNESIVLYIVMGVMLFTIVAGCIAVTIYLNSMEQRKNPTSDNIVEYFPTETAFAQAETQKSANSTTKIVHTTVMTEPETFAVNEETAETAVMETIFQRETIPQNPPQNEIPEIILENENLIIPDYTNQDGNRTEIKLQSAGFRVDRKYEYSDTVPTDAVIRTEPMAGEKTEKGSTICVVVSQGSEMISAEMPDLIGQELEEGKKMMQPYGVHIQVTEVASSQTAGTILSQSVRAGEMLEQGESLELTVSNGEQETGTVTYTIEIPSKETSHFVLDFFDEESNHIASSGSLNSAYIDHSIIVTLEGTGTKKIYVTLQNVNTGLTAEVGSYNFYYDDGTYAAINEDILLAFEEVSPSEETTTEPTEAFTETMETVSSILSGE